MKSNFKILFIILFGLYPISSYSQLNPFIVGKVAFENANYKQAFENINIHLANNPKHQEALLIRAKCNLLLGNYAPVLADLVSLKASKNNELLLLDARANAGLGNNAVVISKLEQYRSSNNKIAEELIKSYPEFTSIKNSQEWKQLWAKWSYTDKEMSMIDIRYALKSARNDEAADRLDYFLDKYINNSESYYLRGNIYLEKNDFKNALDCFENAIKIDNSNLEYKIARAEALMRNQNNKKALEEYNMVLTSDSLAIIAYLGRAEANLYLENYENGQNDISKYRMYYPDNVKAQNIEAQINIKSGDYLSAISTYGRLIKENQGKPEYFIGRADAYLATKTYTYAIQDYSMALDLDPKNIEVYRKKAKAYQLLGDLKGACNEWNHAARLGDMESLTNSSRYCK